MSVTSYETGEQMQEVLDMDVVEGLTEAVGQMDALLTAWEQRRSTGPPERTRSIVDHPVDTPLSAASRFLVELAAAVIVLVAAGAVQIPRWRWLAPRAATASTRP